jgi:hypothetical protein
MTRAADTERLTAELGAGAIGVAMGVSKRESVEAGFAALLDSWGGFEILAANDGAQRNSAAAGSIPIQNDDVAITG